MKIKENKLVVQMLCVCIAVVLWIIVMMDRNPKYPKDIADVPVTIKNMEALEKAGLVMMNNNKDNMVVTFKVRGFAEQLQINKNDIVAFIDVNGIGEGTKKVNIDYKVPNNLEVIDYYPKQITCEIESIVSEPIDISIDYQGDIEDGYHIAYGVSEPTTVKIKGPRSVVNAAKKAVAYINVSKATDSISKDVPIIILDGMGNELSLSVEPLSVKATVPIYPTKSVPIKANVIGEPLEGYKVVDMTVTPESVRIAAPRDVLDSISVLELETLDIEDNYHSAMLAPAIINDGGFIVLDLKSNPYVNVKIEKIIQNSFTYFLSDIEFINIPKGYKVNDSNKDKTIVVTIEDVMSIVNSFSKENMNIVVDLKDAVPGINQVEIQTTIKTEENVTINQEHLTFSTTIIEVEIIDTTVENKPNTDELDEDQPNDEDNLDITE